MTTNVDALLTKIKRKYKEYGINEKPFVVVKADNGTYGIEIWSRDEDSFSCAPSVGWAATGPVLNSGLAVISDMVRKVP